MHQENDRLNLKLKHLVKDWLAGFSGHCYVTTSHNLTINSWYFFFIKQQFPQNGKANRLAPIYLFLKEAAMHEVLMKIDDNFTMIVGDPCEIFWQQLRT
jgi:hypothetical protein